MYILILFESESKSKKSEIHRIGLNIRYSNRCASYSIVIRDFDKLIPRHTDNFKIFAVRTTDSALLFHQSYKLHPGKKNYRLM